MHPVRIDAVNPALNAVATRREDMASARAKEADAALASGRVRGPLHAVSVTIMNAFETAGIRTTDGTTGRAHYVPETNATAVERRPEAAPS
jgi:amidase